MGDPDVRPGHAQFICHDAGKGGTDMLAHFRSEIHDYARHSYLPRGDEAGLDTENIKQRIKDAKLKIQK